MDERQRHVERRVPVPRGASPKRVERHDPIAVLVVRARVVDLDGHLVFAAVVLLAAPGSKGRDALCFKETALVRQRMNDCGRVNMVHHIFPLLDDDEIQLGPSRERLAGEPIE
jgi:hypothetical protein